MNKDELQKYMEQSEDFFCIHGMRKENNIASIMQNGFIIREKQGPTLTEAKGGKVHINWERFKDGIKTTEDRLENAVNFDYWYDYDSKNKGRIIFNIPRTIMEDIEECGLTNNGMRFFQTYIFDALQKDIPEIGIKVLPKEYIYAAINPDDSVTMNENYLTNLPPKEQAREMQRVQANIGRLAAERNALPPYEPPYERLY